MLTLNRDALAYELSIDLYGNARPKPHVRMGGGVHIAERPEAGAPPAMSVPPPPALRGVFTT